MTDPEHGEDERPAASLIRLPNKIKDKVTLGGQIKGDGFDPELLRQAEERAEAMREVFLEAADEDIDRLVAALGRAETDAAGRAGHLAAVERCAHEIKGYGSNIGYQLLTRFGDSLSLFLRKAAVAEDVRLEVARVHVDAMRLVLHQGITGDGGDEGAKLAEGLNSAVRKYVRRRDF